MVSSFLPGPQHVLKLYATRLHVGLCASGPQNSRGGQAALRFPHPTARITALTAVPPSDVAKLILYAAVNVRGIFVANRLQFTDMVKALEMGCAKPIIDKVRSFTSAAGVDFD